MISSGDDESSGRARLEASLCVDDETLVTWVVDDEDPLVFLTFATAHDVNLERALLEEEI